MAGMKILYAILNQDMKGVTIKIGMWRIKLQESLNMLAVMMSRL